VSALAPALKKVAKKAAKKPPAAKMASLTALTTTMVMAPPESGDAHKVVDEIPAVDRRSRTLTCSTMLPSTSTRRRLQITVTTIGEGEAEMEDIEEGMSDEAVAKAKGE
jgi:hypothetical protein